MSAAHRETLEREINLRVEPGFALPRLPGRRLHPRVFTSTYYDTTEYRLAQSGITLRYRREGRAGAWQLKLPAFALGRLIERQCERRRAVRVALPKVWAKVEKRGRQIWT